jgi:hypothetical protein
MLKEALRSAPAAADVIAPCSGCGQLPGGALQIGNGLKLFWIECRPCGRKTTDGQSFAQAVREWNEMQ